MHPIDTYVRPGIQVGINVYTISISLICSEYLARTQSASYFLFLLRYCINLHFYYVWNFAETNQAENG